MPVERLIETPTNIKGLRTESKKTLPDRPFDPRIFLDDAAWDTLKAPLQVFYKDAHVHKEDPNEQLKVYRSTFAHHLIDLKMLDLRRFEETVSNFNIDLYALTAGLDFNLSSYYQKRMLRPQNTTLRGNVIQTIKDVVAAKFRSDDLRPEKAAEAYFYAKTLISEETLYQNGLTKIDVDLGINAFLRDLVTMIDTAPHEEVVSKTALFRRAYPGSVTNSVFPNLISWPDIYKWLKMERNQIRHDSIGFFHYAYNVAVLAADEVIVNPEVGIKLAFNQPTPAFEEKPSSPPEIKRF